ncbi:hypothetical protein N7492_009967 [Penicillium capsulatum]|uniref:Uncharacterized protein n=1 Tax=Penicillium capsulatum TaxID=69766 RepID=A0A9W9LEU1_9EURO|nr:hypothetical protein N7492_009967 [Penicillium capsulatum]KAJ6112477.1 hypothetical protein N7512_007801 [Penicillium capsulatum]
MPIFPKMMALFRSVVRGKAPQPVAVVRRRIFTPNVGYAWLAGSAGLILFFLGWRPPTLPPFAAEMLHPELVLASASGLGEGPQREVPPDPRWLSCRFR